MRLCISSSYDLDQLEAWTRLYFSNVPNHEVVVPALDEPIHPFKGKLGQFLKFVPVKDKDVLSIFWPSLPYTQRKFKEQPLKYYSHLVGHEGPNSLLSYLKK